MKSILFFCFLSIHIFCLAQDNSINRTPSTPVFIKNKADTVTYNFFQPSLQYNKKRIKIWKGVTTSLWAGTVIGLNKLWYKDYPRSKFHFYNDKNEWLQVDKLGHSHTAYFESVWMHSLLRWSGVDNKTATWVGAGLGFAYQLSLEMLDGQSAGWGFSNYDMLANTSGCALFVTQQLLWKEQRIRLKYSMATVRYPNDPIVKDRIENLYGHGFWQRTLKDYNAQSYWLSANVKSFLPKQNKFPNWLNVAIGYSAEGMLGGYANVWKTPNALGQIQTINRNRIPRYRQFFIAPDIDFNRIKTNNGFLKTIFTCLNILKSPSPALEYNSQGKFIFHPLYALGFEYNFQPIHLSK